MRKSFHRCGGIDMEDEATYTIAIADEGMVVDNDPYVPLLLSIFKEVEMNFGTAYGLPG